MRRRFVWIQGGAQPLGANFVALFRRNSDNRLFVHPILNTTDPSAAWSIANFIDTGVNASGLRSFSAGYADGTGWVGFGEKPSGVFGLDSIQYISDTGPGELRNEFATSVGFPVEDLILYLRASDLHFGSAGWGQVQGSRSTETGATTYRWAFDKTGVLAYTSTLDVSLNEINYYALPSTESPAPLSPTNGVFSVRVISNTDHSISIFQPALLNGSPGPDVYITRGGTSNLLIPGDGVVSPLTDLFENWQNWMYGETLYSRRIGSGLREGRIYQISGNNISLIETRTMRLPSGFSGYSLQRFFVTPASPTP